MQTVITEQVLNEKIESADAHIKKEIAAARESKNAKERAKHSDKLFYLEGRKAALVELKHYLKQ